jgi:hypothetical protein
MVRVHRRVLSIVWLLAVAIVVILAVLWLFQRRPIYFPLDTPVPPAKFVLPAAEEISFETEDVAPTTQQAIEEFYPGYMEGMTKAGRERGWGPMTRAHFDGGRPAWRADRGRP